MEELEAWKDDIRIVYSKPVENPNYFFGLPNDLMDHVLSFIKYCPYEVCIGKHSKSFETMNEAMTYRDNFLRENKSNHHRH